MPRRMKGASETTQFHQVVMEELRALIGAPKDQPLYSDDRVREIVGEKPRVLTIQDFNEALAFLGVGPMQEPVFMAVFGSADIGDLEQLREGVNKVRVHSMLFYGNFRHGFDTLCTAHDGGPLKRPPWDVSPVGSRPGLTSRIKPLSAPQAQACGYLSEETGLSPRQEGNARKMGEANTDRYLAMGSVDVYIAGSMRSKQDFVDATEFAEDVMSHPELAPLGLSFFNPLWSYMPDPQQKGLLEQLMLKKASVMLFIAGRQDSFGKDSELATILVQGRPAIAYVPKAILDSADSDVYDRRYQSLQNHPLSMQCDLRTGVANGLMLARTPEICARLLRRVFTNSMEFQIRENDYNYFLEERITGSKVRVVTKNEFLTTSFWNRYGVDPPAQR